MKNKNVLLFSLIALLSSSTLMAQNWKVGGNTLNATGKFGSTNKQDIEFITNSNINGVLTKGGLWGLGITTPIAKLHVNSTVGGQDLFKVQEAGATKFNVAANGGVSIGAFASVPANSLFVSGNAGIGISVPVSKLHVFTGSSGTTPFPNSLLTLEHSFNNYLSILTPTVNESGILFGNAANNVSGGIIYNSSFQGSAPNALQFRTNGNLPRMVVTAEGNVGVGTTNPENFRLKIIHGNGLLNGLAIENATAPGIEWSLFTGAGNSPLNFIRNGAILGQISFPSGQYLALSDERLKTNIRSMSSVLKKINQLKASTYQFKNATDKEDYDGFIAQDVMKIFPNLVTHTVNKESNTDVYLMNYSGFGVIAIKGIQELMKQNDSLKSEVENLKSEMMQIKTMLNIGSQSTGSGAGKISISLTNAALEQNTPNPVSNSTSIRYSLPQKFSNAQLIITDNNGRTMKQVKIADGGNGVVNVDASLLISGTYTYSLIVDGKIISTKQMIVKK